MRSKKKGSLTTRYVLIIGALLLITNIVLGIVLMRQSTSAYRSLIRKNMLDVSNTAAGLLDGDALGALTEEDVGKEAFNDVLTKLAVFQNNIDIEYIYAIRQVGKDAFIFTVDPDPVNPGEFGEPVVVTQAMKQAAVGIAAVDNAPAQDEWGNFYSAFSPVFDSQGRVAGIIGVDFNSEWYDTQIRNNTLSIGVLSLLFVVTGGAVVLMINRKLQQRFGALGEELGVLSLEMDELMGLISSGTELAEEPKREESAEVGDQRVMDELEELGEKIQSMQREMERYLSFVHAQAYTDALTRVGNTTAYVERRAQLEKLVGEETGAFGVAVFDINLLKLVNDRCGHAAGDRLIQDAARSVASVFGIGNTFRIGGDEFVGVLCATTQEEMEERLNQVQAALRLCNTQREGVEILSVSMGASVYQSGRDEDYQVVFDRADEAMYRQKEAFHRSLGEGYSRNSWRRS